MAVASVAAFMATVSEGRMKCPGSPSWIHAKAEVQAFASLPCASVKEEILARVSAQGQDWHDPHNGGTYKLLGESKSGGSTYTILGQPSSGTGNLELELSRTTANGKYMDKMVFTLTDLNTDCMIEACSESQVTSVADFSTNYCNLRMLYCSSADGCKTVKNDFAVEETEVTPSIGAGKDPKACLVKKELRVASPVDAAEDIGDVLTCVSANCPMDPVSMIPSTLCLLQNCFSKLSYCAVDKACRNVLLCQHKCTSPLAKLTDGEHFVAANACVQQHCPGFPVSTTCVAMHCGSQASECTHHEKCRQGLECADGCLPHSVAGAIFKAARSGGHAAKEGVHILTL